MDLSKYKNAVFKYGKMDCCLFVCNVIRDNTGKDYAKPWRGRYSTELGAMRCVSEYRDFVGVVSAAFGTMKPMKQVKTGDPVWIGPPFVEGDSIGAALGIYDGLNVVYITDKGLEKVSIAFGKGCWNV